MYLHDSGEIETVENEASYERREEESSERSLTFIYRVRSHRRREAFYELGLTRGVRRKVQSDFGRLFIVLILIDDEKEPWVPLFDSGREGKVDP